jgi:4'-phosphopantetheinyl transferase
MAIPPLSSLSVQDVHVWGAALKMDASRLQSFERTLSEDELMRAERFHFYKDHTSLIAARGVRRSILAGYLGVEPVQLRFCYSSNGIPVLTRTLNKDSFKLSHSKQLGLFAMACSRSVGIDLERIVLA